MSPNTPMAILTAKRLSKAAVLSLFSASALILAAPNAGHAAAPQCNADNADADSYKISALTVAGFECRIGDKEFSNFAFNGITSGNYGFTIDPVSGDHTFSGSNLNFTNIAGFTYQYTVKIISGNLNFSDFNTGFTASSTNPGTSSFSKVLSAYTAGGTLLGSSVLNPGPGIGSTFNFLLGQSGPITFKNTVTYNSGTAGARVDVITDSITQTTPTTTTETPAPLPLLGAGAAFGMSRKLRRRIKLA